MTAKLEKGELMSVAVTTRIDHLPGDADEFALVPTVDPTGTHGVAHARPERCPVVGAAALDAMAAIAGPAWAPDHASAWSAAFETVVAATGERTEAPEQHVLAVDFRSPDGRLWHAIGGGATVAAAISWARESCPSGATWNVDGWSDLYGE
jgi:hypothetical protein